MRRAYLLSYQADDRLERAADCNVCNETIMQLYQRYSKAGPPMEKSTFCLYILRFISSVVCLLWTATIPKSPWMGFWSILIQDTRTTVSSVFRPMLMETRCGQKSVWISKIPDTIFLYRSLWAQIFTKKVSNFDQTCKKVFPTSVVRSRSAWQKLSQMFV